MKKKRKVEVWKIVECYDRLRNVWRVGEELGLSGQWVHELLTSLNAVDKRNFWTTVDDEVLAERYAEHKASGTLQILADTLGRTKQFICRKAKKLGLTNSRSPRAYFRKWKGMPESEAEKIFDKFKRSRLGLGQFCVKMGYDDLGFSRAMKEHFADEWDYVVESKRPRQTIYRLGRQVEYAIRDDLKKRGYPIALRSPRSGGPADIIALKTGVQLLVQAKRGMSIGVKEWNTLFDLAESVGAIAVLAGRPSGRGIVYKKMTARKDGSRKQQPMIDFDP